MIKKICKICKKEFWSFLSHHRKFCSHPCYYKSKIGSKGYWYGKKRVLSEKWKKNIYLSHPRKENHWNWKGGKIVNYQGYVFILNRTHPFCDHHGYVKRSRLVMEKKLGRYLTSKEQVHHINGIKDDDRIENLQLFKNCAKHTKFHDKFRKRNKLGQFIS